MVDLLRTVSSLNAVEGVAQGESGSASKSPRGVVIHTGEVPIPIRNQLRGAAHQVANLSSQFAVGRPTTTNRMIPKNDLSDVSVRGSGYSAVQRLKHPHVRDSRP